MTPVTKPPPAAAPAEPVAAALADPDTRGRLLGQALALFGRYDPSGRQDAEDAVSEVTCIALGKPGKYDPTRGDVGGWLHGIMCRVVQRTVEKNRRRPVQPAVAPAVWDGLVALGTVPPDREVAARMDQETILARLKPADRLVLELRLIEKLDGPAIAARLDLTPGTARTRLSRAFAAAARVVASPEDAR